MPCKKNYLPYREREDYWGIPREAVRTCFAGVASKGEGVTGTAVRAFAQKLLPCRIFLRILQVGIAYNID
jgi:hypothetical protein